MTTAAEMIPAEGVEGAGLLCAHCSLSVPLGRVSRTGASFCCAGCEAAHAAINACGLGEYYELQRRLGADQSPAREQHERFEEFDDPSFMARHCRRHEGGTSSCEVYLEGVHCAACVWLLERLPRVVDGLDVLELDFGQRTARLVWQEEVTTLSEICRSIARFGYTPHAVEPSATRDARRHEERAALVRLGVAGACAGNVMLIAFALYSGLLSPIGEPYLSVFRWLSAGIGVVSVVWPGRVFFRSAWTSLRTRTWHLDAPIALAIAAGSIAGVVNVIRGAGEIYFDSITMLVFLLLVGRWLQTRQQRMAHDSIELLFSVTPRRARLVDESGVVRETATDAIEPGMLLEVRANESAPVDGVVVSGQAVLDESVLTGESTPVVREAGEPIFAGTVNIQSAVRVRATAVGRETRVGQMMMVIERLSRERTPIIGSADRIAKPFVSVIISLATLTLLLHIGLGHGIEAAFEHAVALLIVCCPCAAALATPIATSASIGRLARRGILVKGGDVFETLSKSPTLLLDKTGTATEGHYLLREWVGDQTLRPVVAEMERGIAHPVATALAAGNDVGSDVTSVEHVAGLGVRASWDGRRVLLGSHEFLTSHGVREPRWASVAAERAAEAGLSVIRVAVEREVVAVALLGDALRADSPARVARLASLGWRIQLLSGDDPVTTRVIGRRLGVSEAHGGASPEDKHVHVKRLMSDGDDVVMVGDGVNDAAALAAATVGVAVSGGAEASLAAADVYFNAPGLGPLVDLVTTSRVTVRVIKRCLRSALFYNGAAAALAMAGFITPIAAAVIMPVSSVTVVSLAIAGTRKAGDR